MDTLLQDIRYGIRMLLKSPGVSIIATIALALGIGANTAIFSVINSVLLKPLPYPNSEALMAVFESDSQTGLTRGSYSYPNFFDLREQSHLFENLACYHQGDFIMTGNGDPTPLRGAIVTADLFSALKVQPMLGRAFMPNEDKSGDTGRVVVISQSLFQSRFNANPNLIGQKITLDGKSFTVVGVMPTGFEFPIQNDPVQMWTTIAGDASGNSPVTAQRGAHFLRVIGRLKEGVTKEQAQAEASSIATRLEQQYPDVNTHKGIVVESSLTALIGDIRPTLLILLGAVACVLLIACANVANLLLARAMTRNKEMAIRVALGAGRLRVVRQLLTESILLSLAGGAAGLLLAVWWSDVLMALGKTGIPRAMHVHIDWRVLGFTLSVSVLTGVLFGLVPAFHSSRTELTGTLKEGGRGSGEGARRNRVRGLLVVTELAIAVVLLVGAGLLIKSLWLIQNVDPGLKPNNVLTFDVVLPEVKYPTEKQSRFFQDLNQRLAVLPGVKSVSSIFPLPLGGDRFSISFQIDGRPVTPKDEPSADLFVTDENYFATMGIPIIKGRDFNARDQHKSTGVTIVTEAFAKQHFPGEEALGKRIRPGISTFDDEEETWREIVGVVGNVRSRSLTTDARPAYYIPEAQLPFSEMITVVKTDTDPKSLVTAVTNQVASMDGDLPVFSVKTMDEYLASSVATPRFNTTLLSIFAGVALVLTIVGLYGVMSYSVAQRTNEIGIRLALGAQTRDVLALVVKQGMRLIVIGLALGLIGAFAMMRLISSLLFGVTTKDPLTFIGAAVLLGLVGLLACYLPARRATRVDPIEALRYE